MPTRSGPGQRGLFRGQSVGVCPGEVSPRPARKLTVMLGGGARLPDDGRDDPVMRFKQKQQREKAAARPN